MDVADISTIVIAGGGLMGSSMAERFAQYGFDVVILEVDEAALDRSRSLVRLHQETLVEAGEVSSEESAAVQARITGSTDVADVAKADFVVETIIENLEAKTGLYRAIAPWVRPGVVVATNTSALPITELARGVADPSMFVGMHWFNPPHLIPLVEVIQGERTSEEAARLVYSLAEFVGKKPVRVRRDAKGFIANRIQFAILREALHIVESGIADVADVDRCMKYGLGFRYAAFGPFEIADLGGLDTFARVAATVNPDLSVDGGVSPVLAGHAESGEFGVKSGRGFYDYSDGRDVEQVRERDRLYLALYEALYR